ncbi:RHS repeat domain-containing protein [Longitalea arenae]|uniref:RHS repeat domain-containing protein n=1 Tax=Longitalea arenae TaxID=2812558 RepID=UPI001967FAAB|nr:RHS repeat-associated core domain-containing protein [Longitalea arenae]
MLFASTAFRIRTAALVLMIMMVQFATAGGQGYADAKPVVKRFDFDNPYTVGWPAWLQGCDSLNRILSGPLTAGNVSYRWQPAYANWLEHAGEEAVSDFIGGYFFIDANALYTFRDPSIRLYQAYESITFDVGFETAVGDEFTADIISLGSQVPAPSNNTGSANSDMNWVLAKSFDENGNVTGESKQFFDNSGRALQSQTKTKYRKDATTAFTHVFASQPVRDALGRDAMATMSAPIDNSEFIYKPDFVRNSSDGAYDYKNFDRFKPADLETDKTNNPDPVGGQNVPGTLGWYYSANNTWEPYTPTTQYPFSRVTYYRDGTGNTKKSAVAGEVFRMGNGHEVSNYVTPVVSELDHYLQVRNQFFPAAEMGSFQTTMVNEAIQTVSIDANGRMGILIQDKGGRTLFSARPGSDLVVNNAAKVKGGEIFYFRLFTAGTVTLSSASNIFYNMETELPVNIGTGGSVAAGYYKVVNTGTSLLTVNYSNGYTDIAYDFYNQLGQLVATIAPEGVKKLLNGGLNNYATKNDIPFITLSEYDVQGRLVKATSTEEGISEMIYRADGKIRFSQNADQKINGRYSYTNYDKFGRAIESGEYKPEAGGIPFNSDLTAATNPMRDILEDFSPTGGLINGTRKDVIMTLYDVANNSHGVAYLQNEEFLGGKVSMTRKYAIIANNSPNNSDLISGTWYNYDEEGKVLWTIHYIKGLGFKTTDYTYDNLGRLVKKDFQKNPPASSAERFIHYYDYDPATQKLWKVFTSVDDVTRVLQATYVYYLHGPLKRVELATDLQGLDYIYTLQGALKAVNNSDKFKDPGGDGSSNAFNADAFGMVLDYYPGDYQNSRTSGILPIKGVNTLGFGADSYTGDIKAMTWFSKKPTAIAGSTPGVEEPTTYVYQYDEKSQFTESTWGTGINFDNTPATFTPTGLNKEIVKNPANGVSAYDANGNILYLQRTGRFTDNFTYNYLNSTTNSGSVNNYNTNKLESVIHNAASGTPETYARYIYNNSGQLITELNTFGGTDKSKYIEYNAAGKVIAIYRDALKIQKVVEYLYDETGDQVIKKSYNAGQLSQITYYMGSVIYIQPVTNGTLGNITVQEYEIQGGGGRLGTFYRQIPVYAYELNDHLGNVRAVVAKSANTNTLEVRMYTDYYPFGSEIRGNGDYRHGYQGQYATKEAETDWNAFELRMYDSRIARWLSVDPAGQFHSPYVAMGNNPVSGTDPDGGFASWPGALFNQLITGNRGHIYKSGKQWGYNCENCGVTDGSGVSFIYRNGQYNRARHEERDRRMNAVNLEFVRQYDYNALNHNQPTITPNYYNKGQIIVSDGMGGTRAVWNEAIEAPMIDPIDFGVGIVSAFYKTTGKAAVAGSINFMQSNDKFFIYASRAAPKEGYLDVIIHGSPLLVETKTGHLVNHRVLAAMIRNNPEFQGQSIRLLSCSTGALPNGFAQRLANKLGVKVLAPTDLVWAHPNGTLTIGPTALSNTGTWESFFVGGRWKP